MEEFAFFSNNDGCHQPDWPQLLQNLRSQADEREYRQWARTLAPRTCLLLRWLHEREAVANPGESVLQRGARLAQKSGLLGSVVERRGGEVLEHTQTLLASGDFDMYVTWLLWLRFQEYIPTRFVLPGGRQRVLLWVREQLGRHELSPRETLHELQWQAARISATLDDDTPNNWRAHHWN